MDRYNILLLSLVVPIFYSHSRRADQTHFDYCGVDTTTYNIIILSLETTYTEGIRFELKLGLILQALHSQYIVVIFLAVQYYHYNLVGWHQSHGNSMVGTILETSSHFSFHFIFYSYGAILLLLCDIVQYSKKKMILWYWSTSHTFFMLSHS